MAKKQPKRFQVLSLSGGGYRGLHVAHALELIEKHNGGQPIAKHFDLIAGTSIGGIIGLALALEIPAKTIREALEELGPKLFNHPVPNFPHVQEFAQQKGLIDMAKYGYSNRNALSDESKQAFKAWYDPAPLKSLLESPDFFGTKRLKEVLHPIIVPAINYGAGLPKFFKTDHHSSFTFDKELLIVDVALGTSAAPVYFPAHKVNDYRIVDGGLIANDPTQVAVHEAMKFFNVRPPLFGDESTGKDDLRVLAIGTLSPKRVGDLTKPLDQGLLDWGSGVFDLATSAQEAMAAFMVDIHMLPGKVYRLPSMDARPESAPNLADVSAQATERLKSSAASLVQTACGKDDFKVFSITPLQIYKQYVTAIKESKVLNLSKLFRNENSVCYINNLELDDQQKTSLREARVEIRNALRDKLPAVLKELTGTEFEKPRFLPKFMGI